MPSKAKISLSVLTTILLLVLPVLADRTAVRAGSNLFTVQQDIEMGRALAEEVEGSAWLIEDSYAHGYIGALGKQLAMHAPGHRYPYQFKIINDDAIAAYSLPGGIIYITSGFIEAAPNEQQLAGALAHQIAHVALRHGSQQVAKAYTAATGSTRRPTVTTAMSRLNLGADQDSVALKYSAEAEQQADLLATQILYDAKFDPRHMSTILQKWSADRTGKTSDYVYLHPNISNRAGRVRAELTKIGRLPTNLRGNSPDLQTAKTRIKAEIDGTPITNDVATGSAPQLPSTRMVRYTGNDLEFRHPENWQVSEDTDSVTLAPAGGVADGSLAYGMIVSFFEPSGTGFFGSNTLNAPGAVQGRTTLARATDELLDDLRRSNPNMREVRSHAQRTVDGEPAMVTELTNDSPLGGREVDWLVTVLRPDGRLHYFIGVVPERDFSRYVSTFDQIVSSARFYD